MTNHDPVGAARRLANLAMTGSGSSRAAASVLVYAWNSDNVIKDLWRLDDGNFEAAMTILRATRDPNLTDGGAAIPRWAGVSIERLREAAE